MVQRLLAPQLRLHRQLDGHVPVLHQDADTPVSEPNPDRGAFDVQHIHPAAEDSAALVPMSQIARLPRGSDTGDVGLLVWVQERASVQFGEFVWRVAQHVRTGAVEQHGVAPGVPHDDRALHGVQDLHRQLRRVEIFPAMSCANMGCHARSSPFLTVGLPCNPPTRLACESRSRFPNRVVSMQSAISVRLTLTASPDLRSPLRGTTAVAVPAFEADDLQRVDRPASRRSDPGQAASCFVCSSATQT